MLPHPLSIAFLFMSIATLVVSEPIYGLLDALKAHGASKFADFIESDSEALQLYLSPYTKTVFAPSDLVPDLDFGDESLNGRALTSRKAKAAGLQCSSATADLGRSSRTRPGDILQTNNQSPLIDDRNQSLVVDTRPQNETTFTKRWVWSPNLRRGHNETTPSLLKISAGLGQITNVIRGDIPYTGGVIHITDSYFTMPQSLSSTSQATNQTAFADHLTQSNLTNTLDQTHSVTVFLPSNTAFASSNSTIPSSQLISDHVIAGSVKYLPEMKDGEILTTQRGETLVINIRDGRYYVNGGLITQANLVLENGVAHVVDKVLKPTPAAPIIGASSTNSISYAGLFGVVGYIGMILMA